MTPALDNSTGGDLFVNAEVTRQSQGGSALSGSQLRIDGTKIMGMFDQSGQMTMTAIPAGMHTMSLQGANGMLSASNIPFEMPQHLGQMTMNMTVNLDDSGELESVTCAYAPDADSDGVMDQSGLRHTMTLADGNYAVHNAETGQTQMWSGGMMQMFPDMNGDFMDDVGNMGMNIGSAHNMMGGAGMSGAGGMGGAMNG